MVILRDLRPSRIIPFVTIIVFLCSFACGRVIYVGDDGQADFDKIQAGIDAAEYNDTVSVTAGIYYENIILKDGIILSGAGADVTIIDANGYGDVVDARANDAAISGFTLRNSGQFDLGHMNCGVYVDGSYAPIIKNNIIAHNKIGVGLWYGANPYIRNNIIENNYDGFYIYGSAESPSNPSIINNTIIHNQMSGIILRVMVSPVITNNIVVGHAAGIDHNYVTGSPAMSYNNLWDNEANYLRDNYADDTLAGPGSISVDPYFARPGGWVDVNDPNLAVGPDDPNAVWIDGDYHLKSQTGRWDPVRESWVIDDITSACIDAGDPNSLVGSEPLPHGGIINMGAYGGTVEASKSPSGTGIYTFVSEQSTIIQSGGIAGVRRTYTLVGQFRLTVDFGARKARFSNVEAIGTDESAPDRKLDPNEVFNMSALTGTIDPNGSVRFTGRTADESDVILDITSFNDSISLNGQTIAPPDSADFFSFSLDAAAKRKYGGGTGEPNDPYLIYTAEQMNEIGSNPKDWNKHFKLMADIDLNAYTNDQFNIIGGNPPFTGVFDGNRHVISNFSYTSPDKDCIGLFGYVYRFSGKQAEIENLGLIDPNINAGTGDYVGSLIGWLDAGTITGCYVEGGNVVGDENVGGLVGAHGHRIPGYDPSVIPPYPPYTISCCYSTSTVKGTIYVGGMAGFNIGQITNCYSMGSVFGNDIVGGLVGQDGDWGLDPTWGGKMLNCYSTSHVVGQSNTGGLVGLNACGMIIYNCFWDVQTSGWTTSDGGTGKTTAEMQMSSTFLYAGWDFVDETENGTEDIWWILEGQDYPHLWWEDDGN
jgi:parallel beta-helix repeat protein